METFYHGTQKLFDRFDLSHAKEGTGLKFGFGVYVTRKYESAAQVYNTLIPCGFSGIPY